MGDFDYMYERGLVDASGMSRWEDEPEYTNYEYPVINKELKSIEIRLTPAKHLTSENAKYLRASLINNKINKDEINLELMHDRYNSSDKFAIDVYCNGTSIGYIQKYDNEVNIDSFCFVNGELLEDISLEWTNNKLILSKYVPLKEKMLSDEQIIKTVTNILKKDPYFKEDNIYLVEREICNTIHELIVNAEEELYTQSDYEKYILNNTNLYSNQIKNSIYKEESKKKEKEELQKKEQERLDEIEKRKKYLASTQYLIDQSDKNQIAKEKARKEKEEAIRKKKIYEEEKKKSNIESKKIGYYSLFAIFFMMAAFINYNKAINIDFYIILTTLIFSSSSIISYMAGYYTSFRTKGTIILILQIILILYINNLS